MKKLRILFVTGLVALLASCGPAKDTTSTGAMKDAAPKTTQDRGRSNESMGTNKQINANKNTMTSGNRMSDMDKSPTRNAEATYRANMDRMYADLDMSQEQVKRFEGEWKNKQNAWKSNNPNKVMNNYETIETQDRILGDILDENQFESYREWVRDNANED